ncbi:hypothetical protein HanIR_Chr16g0793901 [Helianthus annuus]|nr:hypothetical protein HanIR_Chr16g0793901 [Helianthus annuus]
MDSDHLRRRVHLRNILSHPQIQSRSGLWLVYLAGVVQFFTGYFFIWLAVTGVIDRPPVLLMCLFMFMAAHAQTFFSTTNIVVAVRNFPDYSGTSVGIMKVTNSFNVMIVSAGIFVPITIL